MSHRKIIAITGASGFLADYVIKRLLEDGYDLVGLSRNKKNLAIEVKTTDYSIGSLKKVLINVDGIVHLAASRGANERIEDFHQNEIITQNIYEAAKDLSIKHIVFASSISVYSDEEKLPWKESQYPQPVNMYGISKLSNEAIGNIYSKQSDIYIKSLRMAHLFGALEKNNYMINIFMRQAFNKETLNVNDIEGKREFLYAKDAAKAISLAMFKEVSGVFNIGSGDSLNNLEVAKNINKAFKNEGNINIKKNEGILPSSFMDSSKAKEILGYSNDYSFIKAMQEIYQVMERKYKKDGEI